MVEPVAAFTEQLVNTGLGALTSLLDGKPDVQLDDATMNAIPQGADASSMTGWRNRWIQFTWRSSWGTVWPFEGAWGSHCKFKLHYQYGGQNNGHGQYLTNIHLTRGDVWNPSMESRMRVQMGPQQTPTNSAQAGQEPIAVLPVHIKLHEHMDQFFLTGALEHDYYFYLYGNGAWQQAQ